MPATTTFGMHRGWHHVIWVLLCVAAVTNGATFWLKRSGWLEPGAYHDYLAEKARFRVTSRLDPAYEEAQTFQLGTINRLYAVTGTQTITKIFKYGVVLLIIGVSLWTGWRAGRTPRAWTQPLFLGFTAVVLFAALVSWLRFGGLLLLPGVRAFAFLAVALSAASLASTKSLALLSKYLIGLVFLQLILMPPEIAWGLDIFTGKGLSLLPGDRATGTFLQPTTLGLFCVIALMFYVCFGAPSPRMRAVTAVASGIVVIASASASALLLYLLVVGYIFAAARGSQHWSRVAVISVFGVIALLALPWLTGRPEVFASLFGRVLWIQLLFSEAPGPVTVLFGQGLGVGTNAAVHWLRYAADHGAEVPLWLLHGGSHSTVQGLISQVGVVGGVGFYGLLAYGAWGDARARPVYAVIGIASLVTNVIEFYPVDVLYGLLLAHSVAVMHGSLSQSRENNSSIKLSCQGNGLN